MARAYFHGRSALFVCWLLVEPALTRFMDEARAVAASRR